MEIKLYFQMIKRGWWLILLTVLVVTLVSLLISYLTEPQYTATASFLIAPNASLTSGPDVIRGLDTLANGNVVTTTYAQVMNSNRIYLDTLENLKLQSQDLVDYTYQAVILPSTTIIELSVSGPSPIVAADLANAIGNRTIDFTSRTSQVYDIYFLDAAVPPTIPVSPQPLRDASLSLILGLVLGMALLILSEQIRNPFEAYRQRLRIDSVTGVFNSRYFPQLIDEELANKPDNLLSIGLIELNGLRDYLDSLPVASLNWIFQRITESLQKELRGNDRIGRWNEVTFIVMLPSTPGSAANSIFERILQALSLPIALNQLGSVIHLEPNIGGAEYSNNISREDLLAKADNALSQARRDGLKSVYTWSMKNPFWAQNESK